MRILSQMMGMSLLQGWWGYYDVVVKIEDGCAMKGTTMVKHR